MKKHSAFSLIELSVVILIIAILVVAATQSSKLTSQSALSSARTLTKSSPVDNMKGLALWLEPTLKESFAENEVIEGANLTTWKDLNSQVSFKNNFSKTADSHAVYRVKGIGNLPAVYFDGGAESSVFLGAAISTLNNKFTFFIVLKSEDAISENIRTALRNGSTTASWGYRKEAFPNPKRSVVFPGVNINTGGVFTTNAEIISSSYGGSSTVPSLYVNGAAETVTASISGPALTPSGTFQIGNRHPLYDQPWKGFISEIIVFDGVLKNSERKDVEKYLSKKYGIAVAR